MSRSDQDPGDSVASLSRRHVLQMGAFIALAGANQRTARASMATVNEENQIWKTAVSTDLDPRVALFDGPGIALTFSDLTAVDEGYLYAFDVDTGDRLWERPITSPPSVRFHDGVVYHHNQGTLTALVPRTGTEYRSITGEFGQPSVYEGEFAAFSSEFGGATVVNLVDGTAPWTPDDRTLTEPVTLVDGALVLRGDGKIAAHDVETGEQLWHYTEIPTGGLNVSVRASWPYCFVTSAEPAATLALDLRTGTASWRVDRATYPQRFVSGGPEGGIVLATNIGTIAGLDPGTGEERWSQSLSEDRLFLYLVDDGLAVPVAEDHIWAVSLADGRVQWDHELDTPFPIVRESGDTFYAAGTSIRAYTRDGDPAWEADLTGDRSLSPAVSDSHLVAPVGSSIYGFTTSGDRASSTTTTRTPTPTTTRESRGTTSEQFTDVTAGGPASPPPKSSPETTSGTGPGFGGISALFGLGVVAAEILRRTGGSEKE